MPNITVRDGIIHSRKLEYNLVDHCNLSCAQCSHMSPHMKTGSIPLDIFASDINRLSTVYRVEKLRFVGGEPLLNPHILDYIQVARDSGICKRIEIATNGTLLDRAPDVLFSSVDSISVSWYPTPQSHEHILKLASEKCRRYGTKFRVERIERFRKMQITEPIADKQIINDIYQSCMIAHTWDCQTFYDGRFYLCSRPIYAASYLQQAEFSAPDFRTLDGVPLHESDLKERLIKALSSTQPLKACEYCLGTIGCYSSWHQLPTRSRRKPMPTTFNHDMISWKRMRFLLAWRKVESNILKRWPSAALAKWISVALTSIIGD